jgi:hypothetical protein
MGSPLEPRDKAKELKKIGKVLPSSSSAGKIEMHLKFEDNKDYIAYISIDVCAKTHNSVTELDKLKCSETSLAEVKRVIGSLIALSRQKYAQTTEKLQAKSKILYPELSLDVNNMTLFLNPFWNMRLGIFIDVITAPTDPSSS